MAEYKFCFDEQYIAEMMSRYRKQSNDRFWFLPLKIVCFLLLSALFALFVYKLLLIPSLLNSIFLAAVLFSSKFDDWFSMLRLRKLPFFGEEIQIKFTSTGLTESSAKHHNALSLEFFVKVQRLSDGFLIHLNLENANLFWCPDRTLISGNINQVEELFRQNVKKYQVL